MRKKLLARIAVDGPMRFDEFMDRCLYDPEDGFFGSGDLRSNSQGDFVTSPEVSPWFGSLLGRWAADQIVRGDSVLIEVGSGTGSLLEPLLAVVGDTFREVFAVELSPAARRALEGRVSGVTVVTSIPDTAGSSHAVVIVNEVLDNLPVRLVERINSRWIELLVEAQDETLAFVRMDADDELSLWCDRNLGEVAEGTLVTAQIRTQQWLRDLMTRFDSIALCLIDYAATTDELALRPRHEVVRTFRHQQAGFDFLAQPGLTDLTVEVNADVVRSAVIETGGCVNATDQREFLEALGATDVLRDLKERELARARSGDVMGQLTARSEATGLRAILDSSGLGGFSVFVVTRNSDTVGSRTVTQC